MSPDQARAALLDLMAWVDADFTGIELPTDERSLLAVGCFDVTIEHQAAIAVLHESGLVGSMLALLRSPFESLVRGLWILRCADERDIALFKKGKVKLKFAELVRLVEERLSLEGSTLSVVLEKAWSAMNGFTHTGFIQISRRHAEDEVRANYPEHEIVQALNLAGVFGLVAAGVLAELSGRPDLVKAAASRMAAYGSKAP